MSSDIEDFKVYYDLKDIPNHAWCYIAHVKRGLKLVRKSDLRPMQEGEALEEFRLILNSESKVVGMLPAGIPRWAGTREEMQRYLDTHTYGDCFQIIRVLMMVHPEDIKEK